MKAVLGSVSSGGKKWSFVHYYYPPDGKVDHQDYANRKTTTFGYDDRGITQSGNDLTFVIEGNVGLK